MEKYRWLAAIIAAHQDGKVYGRTRLQKTVKLLQRLGAPMDYGYSIHFYGPYSEGLHADIGLLDQFGLIQENERQSRDDTTYYVLEATDKAASLLDEPELQPFLPAIKAMEDTDPVILELAATYDAFREQGDDHQTAWSRLHRKKGSKCNDNRAEQALIFLQEQGLHQHE